jgi:hypothetical protein
MRLGYRKGEQCVLYVGRGGAKARAAAARASGGEWQGPGWIACARPRARAERAPPLPHPARFGGNVGGRAGATRAYKSGPLGALATAPGRAGSLRLAAQAAA